MRIILLLLYVLPSLLFAQEPSTQPASSQAASAPASAPAGPVPIYVGLYFLRIDNLDLKAGSATITYYIWTRWRGDIDGANYEVMNGTVASKDSEYKEETNGEKYAYYRCQATTNAKVNFRNFPFDEHTISLEFEHAELGTEGAYFVVDEESMKHFESPQLSGWNISAPRYSVTKNPYQSNWGMPGVSPDDKTVFSHFKAELQVSHDVSATFTKTFLLLFISMLISYLAFLIHPTELEARIGIGVAGIFGAVTSQSVVTDSLPEVSYLTLSDKIHIASLLFIFFALLGSCFVGYLCRKDKETLAERIDWIVGVVATIGYISLVVIFIVFR